MFYKILIAFFIGVIIRSLIPFGFSFVVFIFFISIFLSLYSLYLKKIIIHNSLFFILLLLFSLGLLRTDYALSKLDLEVGKQLVGNNVQITGVILGEPSVSEKHTGLKVRVLNSEMSGLRDKRIKIVTSPNFKGKIGDEIEIKGKIAVAGNYGTENMKRIVSSLSDGVILEIGFPEIQIIKERSMFKWKRTLSDFKNAFIERLENVISFPYSTLGAGMTIAGSGNLSQNLKESFIKAGLIHIVVLSGYNVAIVAEVLGKMVWFLPRFYSFSFGILGIILFILLAGGTAPLVRAGIMASIVLFARLIGRPYDATRALFLAGAVMVFINPNLLLFDLSFQLSFLASLGVIEFTPIISTRIAHKIGGNLSEIISSSLAAQIAVAPVLLFSLGRISIVGIITNILVVPFVPLAMLLTAMSGLSGFVVTPISMLLSLPTQGVLFYIVKVAEIFSQIPFAQTEMNIGISTTVFLYIVLICIWRKFSPVREAL